MERTGHEDGLLCRQGQSQDLGLDVDDEGKALTEEAKAEKAASEAKAEKAAASTDEASAEDAADTDEAPADAAAAEASAEDGEGSADRDGEEVYYGTNTHWSVRGNALVGLAFLLPIVLGLSFGILEFSVLIFDFHRANEATRRIARQAAIIAPLVDQATLSNNGSATCTGTACKGLAALTEVAKSVFPKIGPENVAITYSLTDIGRWTVLVGGESQRGRGAGVDHELARPQPGDGGRGRQRAPPCTA
ncbi:MAG: pilus assembly protein [Nitrospinae bacterium]|nr:pilus assembly protein [Nitrospinota bacterium]